MFLKIWDGLKMKNDFQHPIMTIAILICIFSHGTLAYTNWGNEWQRSLVAVFSLFWAVGLGIWCGMEKEK